MGSSIVIKQADGELRRVGSYVEEEGSLYLTRTRKKHFMRKLNAWGLDREVFEDLYENRGLKEVKIFVRDRNKRVVANAEDFVEHGEYMHFKPHRPQIFLNEEWWEEA